ncbi:MAG TPA: nitroreductase family protein [Dehalococcoidia bacterium]|nr:nitroreductase family protein [Dehalococcoidia bacterium]
MDFDALLELLKSRRSIRRFKSDPVPDDYVDKIIEAARWAPSGFNLQPWEFVVVRDSKLKESIAQFCRAGMENVFKMEAAREAWQGPPKPPPHVGPGMAGGDWSTAPVFILLFGDKRTNVGLPMYRRYDPMATQEAFMGGLASAFLYMHLAAASLGLSSQWVSGVTSPFAHCMVKNLLHIPEPMEVYDMMALGYGAATPPPRLVREKDQMVHYDVAQNYRSDEEVKEFIKKIRGGG